MYQTVARNAHVHPYTFVDVDMVYGPAIPVGALASLCNVVDVAPCSGPAHYGERGAVFHMEWAKSCGTFPLLFSVMLCSPHARFIALRNVCF